MSTTPGLELRTVKKIYASDDVAGGVREATFALESGAFFTLLGPSGCGKTTTLRCIAGLETPSEGLIRIGDTTIFDSAQGISVPVHRRNIGMVFQSYAIWPHMTVFENVAFPLRAAKDRKFTRSEIDALADRALASVNLSAFKSRSATRLSGGQQQRVALARAIVRQPSLLLLDEPLSNLDAALRDEMRDELKRLQANVGITTVYVTHDQTEALEMSDQIAVLNQGSIVQVGRPDEIYFRPKDVFVAGFVGSTNLLQASVEGESSGDTIRVRLANGDVLRCSGSRRSPQCKNVTVSVRPESIDLSPKDCASQHADDINLISGQIARRSFLGNMMRYSITSGSTTYVATARPEQAFDIGTDVVMRFPVASAFAIFE